MSGATHRAVTTVFVTGSVPPWTPVGAITEVCKSTSANVVVERALLNTGLSDHTVRSVQTAPSFATAARACGIAPNDFVRMLSRFMDPSNLGTVLFFLCA